MQKLPREQKELAGTLRPSRECQGIDPGARLREPPAAPADLIELATGHWNQLARVLVGMDLLTEADLPMLKLTCQALATADELETAIKKDGYLLPAANGGLKSNPTIKVLESTRNQAHRLLSDFGLSPKSRKFVSRAPTPKGESRFARFRPSDESVYDHLDDDDWPPISTKS